MFSCRISPISLHLSLFLSSFVNCYVYMIVRSSLKNNYLYEIHCIYSSLFSCLGYSTNIQKLAHIRMDFAGIMQTIGIKGRYVGFTYIRPLYGFAPFWRS